MAYFNEAHYEAFYQFLVTLDCYLHDNRAMAKEVSDFADNPKREIAAFVSQYSQGEIEVPQGYTRILYILEGAAQVEIDGIEHTYQAGHLFLSNSRTKITYRESKDTAVVCFYFKDSYFTDSLLTQFVEEQRLYRFFVEAISEEFQQISRYLIFHFDQLTDVHVYSLLLLKQVVKMSYFNNKVTKAAFVLLIVEISQGADQAIVRKDHYVANDQLIEEVLAYIDTMIRVVKLEETAAYFHFHPNYLSALLKEKTGQTFTEIVLQKRLLLAQKNLSQTNLSVQEIVEHLGYKDKAFFYKKFKQVVGMTPRMYRIKCKEQEEA
ncbi:helix-turn-helix transcriptional regulator [Candidatus Enterococcus ferrettii]|uniref:HTH araC/xylS-type domain-containing protein n=1 Tax=Candidatus Enterococcus ferrettii TaxID=2815324 RepID=A0ABV0EK33_9ENTE|nr:AraC family transcriptional regulator [Enterococcus sp. 665A]MBO1338334.1 helix-turn-helix domain-containing protein [Enterococcus sp. 665A]